MGNQVHNFVAMFSFSRMLSRIMVDFVLQGALSGMAVSLCSVIFIAVMTFTLDKPYFIPLPTSVDNCPIGTNTSLADAKRPPEMGEL